MTKKKTDKAETELTEPALEVVYRNHAGVIAKRRIMPQSIWFGGSPWHDGAGEQWFLDARDLDKSNEIRSFRLDRFLGSPEEQHVCKEGAQIYFCPTAGETESSCHGGFDVCCDKPELHIPEDKLAEVVRRPQEMHKELAETLGANKMLDWDRLMEWAQETNEWATKRALSSDKHMVATALGLNRDAGWLDIIAKAKASGQTILEQSVALRDLRADIKRLEAEKARLHRELRDAYTYGKEQIQRFVDRLEHHGPEYECTRDHSDPELAVWYDRTVCPEPCSGGHSRCEECGAVVGEPSCVVENPEKIEA